MGRLKKKWWKSRNQCSRGQWLRSLNIYSFHFRKPKSCIKLTLAMYTLHQKEYFITRGKMWKENNQSICRSFHFNSNNQKNIFHYEKNNVKYISHYEKNSPTIHIWFFKSMPISWIFERRHTTYVKTWSDLVSYKKYTLTQ